MKIPNLVHKLGGLTTSAIVCAGFGLAAFSSPASAALLARNTFNDAALSIDAFGSTSNSGTISTNVSVGATVLKAYLYTSSVWDFSPVNDVKLNGNLLKVSDATVLTPDANPTTTVLWDVTSILGSLSGLQNHTIEELGDNDGSTLVVAYKDASTTGFTSFIFDGELATTGDTTTFNFAQPYTGGDFLVSIADSFSFQTSGQFTTIDVTTDSTPSRRLTSSAGGQDDGSGANGALITAGGIGDSPTNPDPFASDAGGFRTDDEYYNLALGNSADPNPFIKPGDTFVTLNTRNPSNDDNVYGLFVTSTFRTSTTVPESNSILGVLALGAVGVSGLIKRNRHKVAVKA
ncbi:parallel beta-helix repeat [Richelia sinica FACHB-800]|uniref:Parallel beta-helix repeat n=1 Tax=Richelia sinica FACHB-800 TaxID=1357546 RepID=A0A975T451_9NOST|nr:PEP-CTERM sorting domain-containing protein [Richelia sinica]MBD2662913.1 PEP-CTERM sorting domain-containing protein [Richelia sinica FACHB-800]QXE21754.1 parallel beta-helix repeat [Richelia sinica FACHB-800]